VYMLRQELESDSWLKIAVEEVQRYRRMRERGKSYSNERRKGVESTESQLPDDNCVVVSVQADTNMESSPHANDQMISDTSDSDFETLPSVGQEHGFPTRLPGSCGNRRHLRLR